MMFKCKVCVEKDKRISELKDQILHLRSLVYPINDAIGPTLVEEFPLDKSAKADPVEEFQQQQLKEIEEVLQERDKLLSGQY